MNSRLRSLVLVTFSAISLPVLLHAQHLTQFTPNFVDADVRKVVETVAQATESEVVIQAGVQGRVTLQSNAPLTPDELRRFMIARLLESGYEVSDRDGVLLIGPRQP